MVITAALVFPATHRIAVRCDRLSHGGIFEERVRIVCINP